MAHWAYIGCKCVCIGTDFHPDDDGSVTDPEPVIGEVVTVDDVIVADGAICLGFSEYPLSYFGAVDFRPVTERTQEQDLQHFAPLLNTVTSDEDA